MDRITDTSNYQLTHLIGEGGMGSVYEGILSGAEGFRKRVAIKTILESLTDDREFVEMFIGEAKLVADLVHENIVQIYQLGHIDNAYYIAMEHINGINMEELANKHKELGMLVPVEWSAFIASRVARGLEYAHSRCGENGEPLGVVHRDVSPRNIMMRIDGVVKLTDFGIAKAANLMASREGETLMGKWMYMSPEQASFCETDGRSDIFSLGICLHELLTDQLLFAHEDLTIVRDNLLNMPIPHPRSVNPKVPEDLDMIVMKMLERDLEKRYPDATTLSYDLEYHLYNKGYGPTNQTFGRYLNEIFPEIRTDHRMSRGDTASIPPCVTVHGISGSKGPQQAPEA